MTAIPVDTNVPSTSWQTEFLQLLPAIKRKLLQVFRRLKPASLDDAIADGTVICMLSFKRLHEQGRGRAVTAANLAWYAAIRVRSGRASECRLNINDPLSRYAQLQRLRRNEPLFNRSQRKYAWMHEMIDNRHASIVDQVAARIDIAAWFATLCRRYRKIAKALAHGCSTSEVACKFGVTSGRISQIRRELAESWRSFQGTAAVPVTGQHA